MSEVTFQSIEPGTLNFGREDCINRNSEYKCLNVPVIEAVANNHCNTARVRCCKDRNCMERARVLALASVA